MKVIVITGSTRGIGFGLAQEFLKHNCAVVVSGRTSEAVNQAALALKSLPVPSFVQAPLRAQKEAGTTQLYLNEVVPQPHRVLGQPCDVTDYAQVQTLWEAACSQFGRVDVWINNAGLAHSNIAFWEQAPELFAEVVNVNMVGLMNGCRVAVLGLKAQHGGALYNMHGFGSNGRVQFGLGVYGSTKAAAKFLTRSLRVDVRGLPILIGEINPGMVITDLIVGQYQGRAAEFEKAKRIFNLIADKTETVAPFIVAHILKGTPIITWLTPTKLLWRFLTARFRPRNLFETPND